MANEAKKEKVYPPGFAPVDTITVVFKIGDSGEDADRAYDFIGRIAAPDHFKGKGTLKVSGCIPISVHIGDKCKRFDDFIENLDKMKRDLI